MHDRLKQILLAKEEEVEKLKERPLLSISHAKNPAEKFKKALQKEKLAVIAEIKRKSPSKGILAEINDPATLAKEYELSGASVISVLTDSYFAGSLQDLQKVSETVEKAFVLRKDFIIDAAQIPESVVCGADAILLIVKILGRKTKQMIEVAAKYGLAAIVEVHDEKELELALNSGAEIIGVNNRDLQTFEVDLKVSERLIKKIPKQIIRIAESGIFSKLEAKKLRELGYDAILVGEALVTADDPKILMEELQC